MSVLDRDALQQSPLADLHAIASELSIDGYRRLRKAELIEAIMASQQGDGDAEAVAPPEAQASPETPETPEAPEAPEAQETRDAPESPSSRRRRGRRGGRGRAGESREGETESAEDSPAAEVSPETEASPDARSSAKVESSSRAGAKATSEEETVEGVVELLGNGSGFVRVDPPEPSDGDVYISAAQVKRCELVPGDTVAGPRRPPRRSERFASLIRVDSVNGLPVAEVGAGTRFDELPAAFPSDRFRLGSDDPTLAAVEFLTPFGRGSRITVTGPARAGKSELLRRLVPALSAQEGIQVSLALAGVRPEEIAEWNATEPAPAAAVSLSGSADAQGHAVELVIDQARRVASRGGEAVVIVDTLDGLNPHAARKVLAAARKLVDGGSLTVIATSTEPVGGETTVIALDRKLTSTDRFPALDLAASGTVRPELLVGEDGATAIAKARLEALGG